MKLIQLLNEIRVNSPLTTLNILFNDKGKQNNLVDSLQRGDRYTERLVKVSIGSDTYPINVIVKHTYMLVFHLTIFKEGPFTNLDDDQKDDMIKRLEAANRLEDLLKKDKIPYERSDAPNSNRLENMYIYLDKNLINKVLYIDGVPFRDLVNKAQ